MDDLISRQAVLYALKGLPTWWADEGGYYGGAQPPMVALLDPEDAVSAIENLPSAQPATNCSEIPNSSDDTISRQAALDAIMGQPPEPHYPSWYAAQIEKLPAAQPDHVADIGKKASISCGHEDDLISRRSAIALAKDICVPTEDGGVYRTRSIDPQEVRELPAVQPDRDVIDDCLHHIYKNISVHTATGGVIAIRYYMEKLYEEIYGEGERPWWMT